MPPNAYLIFERTNHKNPSSLIEKKRLKQLSRVGGDPADGGRSGCACAVGEERSGVEWGRSIPLEGLECVVLGRLVSGADWLGLVGEVLTSNDRSHLPVQTPSCCI